MPPDYNNIEIIILVVGDNHTCIATSQKTVCFGLNVKNQIDVPDDFKNGAKLIAAGGSHTCMSKENLTQCFGNSNNDSISVPEEFANTETIL